MSRKVEFPKPENKVKKIWNIILVFAIVVVVVQLVNNNKSQSTISNSANEDLWYSGGTLHSLKTEDWRNATYKNKLATCADWAASVKKSRGESYNGDLVSMRRDARNILTCVEEVAKEESLNMKLTEVVASCVILMEADL